MQCEGRVQHGIIVIEAGEALAEGTKVLIVPIEPARSLIVDHKADDPMSWVQVNQRQLVKAWPVEDFSDWGLPDAG